MMPPNSSRGRRASARSVARHQLQKQPLPLTKKCFFALICLGVFFAGIECLCALLGFRPEAWDADPYFGFSSRIPLYVAEKREDGTPVWQTAANRLTYFNRQQFLQVKGANTYRIFCLGGSTTYGHPYDDRTSFAGWLRTLLPLADSSHPWEVVNAGGISYASYRVALLMEELIPYQPDLFVIYSGHNEFLERRTYGQGADAVPLVDQVAGIAKYTRTYSLAKRVMPSLMSPGISPGKPELSAEVDAILDRSVGPDDYTREQLQRSHVLQHYELNLIRMLRLAQSVGAKVIFVTPASNLRDCAPFKSEHRPGLSATELRQWADFYRKAQQESRAESWQAALEACDAALRIDDQFAQLHYLRARVLLALGKPSEAKLAFVRARDEDICPLRALSPIQEIVKRTAQTYHVPCFDFIEWSDQHSPNAIPGESLFLDHVHPTIDANRQLAVELVETMVQANWIVRGKDWNPAALESTSEQVRQSITDADHATALRNVAKVFGWAGRFDEAGKLARKVLTYDPNDGESHYILGVQLAREARHRESIEQFQLAEAALPHYTELHVAWGNSLLQLQEFASALAHFETGLSVQPHLAKAHLGAAKALIGLGQPNDAIAHLESILQRDSRHVEAQVEWGKIMQQQGATSDAIAHWQAALQIDPNCATAHFHWANLLQERGEFRAAEEHYRRAIQIQPDFVEAYNNWASTLQSLGQLEDAITRYREAIQISPDYAKAHYNLGVALQGQGRLEEAIRAYEQAARGDTQFAEVHNNWGAALQASGNSSEAIRHYEIALQIRPDFAEAHNNWGNALRDQNQISAAIQHYEAAVGLRPDLAEAHFHWGVALARQNNLRDAIAQWEHALRINPQYQQAQENIRRAQDLLQRTIPETRGP